jgi:hypothetical protein
MDNLLCAQVENSLECGWKPSDIILIANFDCEFKGIKAQKYILNNFCFTGSKMFALQHLIERWGFDEEVIWMHDLDCWQNQWFACPEIRDVGICEYSEPKFNGGSVFWRRSAHDIVDQVVAILRDEKASREEPTLNRILKNKTYMGRLTVLNPAFNVGCSGFVERYERAVKPIHVCHLHPTNRIAWETHVLDRNGCGYRSVGSRLEALLRRYYSLATELSVEGKEKQRSVKQKMLLAERRVPFMPKQQVETIQPKTCESVLAPRRCYRLLRNFHLGDRWARLNCALRLLEAGDDFALCIRDDLTREILELLDVGALQPVLTTETPNDNHISKRLIHRIDSGDAAYRTPYFPTKREWRPNGQIVSYSFSANYTRAAKVPPQPAQIIEELRSNLPSYHFVEVGKLHQASVTEVVRILAQSHCLLSIDNGIAHIARSVGVPLFLLEHLAPISRGFPPGMCRYTKVTQSNAATVICDYLRGKSPLHQGIRRPC